MMRYEKTQAICLKKIFLQIKLKCSSLLTIFLKMLTEVSF